MSKRARIDAKVLGPVEYPALKSSEHQVKLFMDSGVFGAWNRGTKLDLQAYCDFIKANDAWLQCYAGMDVIPGFFGEKRTTAQVEGSASESHDNQLFMKKQGLTPIPIFHQGESFRWLEKMLDEGEPYIGISTAKDLTHREHRVWLDQVFSMITNDKGHPYVRTHGFGVTTIPLLLRYPWFTSDSTTWSLAAGYGLIYMPTFRGSKPDYTQNPTRIIMSGRQQVAWSSAKRQYEALSPVHRAAVDAYLEYLGITLEEARYQSASRRAACLRYFMDFHTQQPLQPFRHRNGPTYKGLVGRKPPEFWEHMTIIFATLLTNGQFSRIMNNAGANNRLVSYFEFVGKSDYSHLHNFVEHGIHDVDYVRRPPKAIWNDTYTSHRRMKLFTRIKELPEDETNAIG